MTISETFEKTSWYPRLHHRGPTFKAMIQHLEDISQHRSAVVAETGSSWDEDNFEGQGQSTLIWNWFHEECRKKDLHKPLIFCFELRPSAIETALRQAPHVTFVEGDSLKNLYQFKFPAFVDLVYLDSFDWTEEMNLEASAHALMELTSIIQSLHEEAMICVDDRQGNFRGKHWMVEAYMQKLGAKEVFKNHQIAWRLP